MEDEENNEPLKIQIPGRPIKPTASSNSLSEYYGIDSINDEFNDSPTSYSSNIPPNHFAPINREMIETSSPSRTISSLTDYNSYGSRPNSFSLTAVSPKVLEDNMSRALTPNYRDSPKISAEKLTDNITRLIRASPDDFKAKDYVEPINELSKRDKASLLWSMQGTINMKSLNKSPTFMKEYNELKRGVITESPNKGGKLSRKRKRKGKSQLRTLKKYKGRYSKSKRSKRHRKSRKYY